MSPAGFAALVQSDISALVREGGRRAEIVMHLNVAAKYVPAHPTWSDACIPGCDSDGDGPLDRYTTDPALVTCPACAAATGAQ